MRHADIVCALIAIIVVIAFLFGLYYFAKGIELDMWNNGICSCGGHYKFFDIIGHAYSTDYVYKCDQCGTIIEISSYIQEKTS